MSITSQRFGLALLPAAALAFGWVELHGRTDFGSCSDELDRVRRAASDAQEKAADADSASDDLETARNEMESECSSSRLSRFGCQSARNEYESKRSTFEDARDDFGSEYDTLASRLRSAASECDALARPAILYSGVAPVYQRSCRSLRKLVALGVPAASAQTTCVQGGMPAEQCRACLLAK